MSYKPAAVRRYWNQLAAMGCIISGGPAEIAHCHGGSITERTGEKAKGVKLAYMDWLVLPLAPRYARHPYPLALDTDVEAWEARYGTQAEWIDRMIARTGVNVWEKARSRHAWAEPA